MTTKRGAVLALTAVFVASAAVLLLADSPRPSPSPAKDKAPRPSPSAKVFTNRDLRSPEPEPEGDAASGKAASPRPKPSASPTPDANAEAVDRERQQRKLDEAIWKQRASDARESVRAAQANLTQLDERATTLQGRITMSTDTNEILRLQDEQQKLGAERDAARLGLEQAKKALEDLMEEARRAGIPPGWIREP